MKTQKCNPFFFALQSELVPQGKILAQYYYYNQKLFIQLENERDVFGEGYLVAYDKKNSQFIAIQELTRESSDIYSIIFHDGFLSRLESVEYVRLCLAMYKNGEYVYAYLNSPDINEKNYSICDAYIATILSKYLDNDRYRLVLYYSKAGALSIKPLKDDREFENYLRPHLLDAYVDSQKIYFKFICTSSYMYDFTLDFSDEKEALDLCIENREPYVRNLEKVTASCELDDINIYGQIKYKLLPTKEDNVVIFNGEKLIVFDGLTCLFWPCFGKKAFGKITDNSSLLLTDASVEDILSPEKFFYTINRMNSLIEIIMKKEGYISYYCQRIFAESLCLMLESLEPIMDEYTHPDYNFKKEWQTVSGLLCHVEDKIIMERKTSRFKKLFLLDLKYNGKQHFEIFNGNLYAVYDKTWTFSVGEFIARIDLMQIKDGRLIIEGNCHIPIGTIYEDFYIYTVINGEEYDVLPIDRNSDRYFFDKAYLHVSGFKLDLSLNQSKYKIQLYNHVAGHECVKENIEFMQMSPLGTEVKFSYYYNDGYIVTTDGRTISCIKCSERERQERERKFQEEIRKADKEHAGEICSLRNYYWDNINKKTSEIWLVTDRPNRADDNGEAFFRYMTSHPKGNIDCSFVLGPESEKYEELKVLGNVIEPYTIKHKQVHLLADYIISSQMSESAYNPFDEQYIYFRDLYRRNKFIFLQHGVIHNQHGRVLGKYNRNFYGLIASASREAEYFMSSRFHYTGREVWLTGLPRFDRLYHDEKKVITIMPTWRKYLTIRAYDSSIGTKNWIVKDTFAESEYFNFFNHLINDERLLSAAEEYGYKICFMPHVTFLHLANLFHKDARVEIYEYEKSYREIYAESNLIVTDYSSAVFDFAYLQKPVLYCQFDQKDFWTKHTVKKGYWSFEEDGFGEVTYDADTLIDLIIEYIKSGCVLKDLYRKRIQDFFAYADQNCCERIYNRIVDLEKR